MNLYYSVVDPYPAYRVDLAELFGVELQALGVNTEWFMAASTTQIGSADFYSGQTVHRPDGATSHSRIIAKLHYWLADLKHLLLLLFRKVDAIQCRDKYIASLAALCIAFLSGVPFFYWCSYPFPEHDRLAADALTGWSRWIGRAKAYIRFQLLYKIICHFSDHVFVQSQRMKEDMHGYGIPLEKMTPVPMGVSTRISKWIATNPTQIDPLRVVYLGTLAKSRQLEMLLDAFLMVKQTFTNAQLVFVGDGDQPSERIALEEKAEALGLQANVVFTGFVPMEEAWALSASAAICVSPIYPSPALIPASPTKIVEYLALGRPVVCNDHPEQSQIIAESGAGLCVEWSAAAFSDAIVKLLNDPVAAATMAKRGPAWVAKHRTYPTIAKVLWLKYQSLVPQAQT